MNFFKRNKDESGEVRNELKILVHLVKKVLLTEVKDQRCEVEKLKEDLIEIKEYLCVAQKTHNFNEGDDALNNEH